MNYKVAYFFLLAFLIVTSIQGVNSQVIKNETKITIDDKGKKTTERTILIRINEKQSNWLSHIEIGHDPKQDFSFNYARVIDLAGNNLRKLKKRDISTRNNLSYGAYYQDDLIKEFDLYWGTYPYQIEYSYSITEEEFLYVAFWTPILYANVSTITSTLELNTPLNYQFHLNQEGDFQYTESVEDDIKIYHWKATLAQKPKDEIYSPAMKDLIPKVQIIPHNFKYGVIGSSDSWSSFGSWLKKLNEGTDQLPLSEKIIIEDLISGISDKREIIKNLYYYLQDHTRYLNVAIEVGGLKSYPASYVCKNKYGDCKALTTYMQSMLKSVGIDSYYTIINAGKNEARIKADLPGQQFNHVILAVPFENDTIWLENTSNIHPFNYLGTFTQNRYGLALNGESSNLVKTPKLNPEDVLVKREITIYDTEEDDWGGEILVDLKGEAFEDFRYSFLKGNDKNKEKQVLTSLDLENFSLNDWKAIDYHRDSTFIKVFASGKIGNPIRKIGNLEVINPLRLKLPDFEEPGTRKLDVSIKFPINKSDRIVFKMTNLGDKEVQIPQAITLNSMYGQYSARFEMKDNSILAHEQFTLLDNEISLEKYSEFYSFIQSVINYKKKSAILIK